VTNTGTANLVFSAISLGTPGPNANQFLLPGGGTCVTGGTGLAPNGSCSINVSFRPTSGGSKAATLTLTDNAVPATQTVSVSGTGLQGTVSFTSASFSANGGPLQGLFGPLLNFGNLSGPQYAVVTLRNSGNAPVTYTSAAVTGAGAFSKGADSCSGQTVAPNGTCTIRVNFAAPNTALPILAGTLTVVDDALGGQQQLMLSGR
jgi:hypothetical protein